MKLAIELIRAVLEGGYWCPKCEKYIPDSEVGIGYGRAYHRGEIKGTRGGCGEDLRCSDLIDADEDMLKRALAELQSGDNDGVRS